jgi:4-hydroxy-2-oxoheptanedioate aldolase
MKNNAIYKNMNSRKLKDKLYKGDVCLGTWLFIPSQDIPEIVALAGLDFVVIDMEHSPISYETMRSMITGSEVRGITPIVRPSSLNESDVLRALDTGAHGVHIPQINTFEDSKKLIEYSKYSPLGNRGMAPSTRAGNYSLSMTNSHMEKANNDLLNIISLESVESINELDKFLDIEEIDVIYIGPYDLSQSLGVPGEVNSTLVLKEMEKVFKRITNRNKIAGTFANSKEQAKLFLDIGVKYLTCETDGTLLCSAYSALKKDILDS